MIISFPVLSFLLQNICLRWGMIDLLYALPMAVGRYINLNAYLHNTLSLSYHLTPLII